MDDHAASHRGTAMTGRLGLGAAMMAGAAVLAACGATPATTSSPSPARAATQLMVFTDKPPAVAVFEPATGKQVARADIAGFADWTWTWNDDNNFSDGKNVWLGLRNPTTDEATVVLLDLDKLTVVNRIDLGKDHLGLYIGKGTRKNTVTVGKMASGQVVSIDAKSAKVVNTWTVPVNGDVVCDADVATAADGVQRFFYPTRKGDTVVSLNPETGATLKMAESPKGSNPFMLTTAPNGSVWVQESGSNSNSVYDGPTLTLTKRIPVGKGPIVASFSPDGKFGYVGHNAEPAVFVIDSKTLEVVQRVEVGTFPSKLAVDPGGKVVYAMLSKEKAVAVIDTNGWQAGNRIPLGSDPSSLYIRSQPSR